MDEKTYTAKDVAIAHDCGYQNGEADGQMRERERIVKWLTTVSDPGATFADRRLAYQIAANDFADAIQRGEHWQ